jgi:hypothetical protein
MAKLGITLAAFLTISAVPAAAAEWVWLTDGSGAPILVNVDTIISFQRNSSGTLLVTMGTTNGGGHHDMQVQERIDRVRELIKAPAMQ